MVLPPLLLQLVLRLVLVLRLLHLLQAPQRPIRRPKRLRRDLRLAQRGGRRRHEGTARGALGMPRGEQRLVRVLRDGLQYSGDSLLYSPTSRGHHA